MTAPKTLEEKAEEWLFEQPHCDQVPRHPCPCDCDDQGSLAALLASERAEVKAEALRVVEELVPHMFHESRCLHCEVRARLEALQ